MFRGASTICAAFAFAANLRLASTQLLFEVPSLRVIFYLGPKTEVLLESMVKEARMVVFNAVAKATSGSKMDIRALQKNDGMKPN